MFLISCLAKLQYSNLIGFSPDHPLAAWEEGEELCGHGAAEEGEDGDSGDGQGDGQQGLGRIAADDPAGDRSQEEQVHEVHAEGKLTQRGDDSARPLDAAEEQEGSEGGHQHIGRAELPRPLQHRGLDEHARLAFPPEAPGGEGGSDEEAERPDGEAARAIPAEVHADVVGQHQIAQIA